MISYDMNYVDVWTHIIISFYKIDERESLVLTTLKSLVLNTMFYSLANWPFVWLSVQIVLNLGVWCLMEFMLFNMKNIELNWAKIISVLLKFNFFLEKKNFLWVWLVIHYLYLNEGWTMFNQKHCVLFCKTFATSKLTIKTHSRVRHACIWMYFGWWLFHFFFSFRLKKNFSFQ